MLRFLALVVVVGLLAGCAGREETGPGVALPTSTSVVTTSPPVSAAPSTVTTVPTTTTSTSTSTTTTTTTTQAPDTESRGTPVAVSLPPGAIGPSEFYRGDDSLRARIGVRTYRIETTVTVPLGPDGDELGVVVAQIDVDEGDEGEDVDSHLTIVSAEDQPPYRYEEINLDGRTFVREGDDDWYESAGDYDLVGPVAPMPFRYSDLNEVLWVLSGADWLGNEEIDGVPVGHFTWSESDDTSGVSVYGECWVDAEGVVWRWIYEIRFGEMLFSRSDAALSEVGADVSITVPEGM